MESEDTYEYVYDRMEPSHSLNLVYTFIFTFGFVGNLYAFRLIFKVLKNDFKRPTKNSNFVLCLLFMATMDFIALLILPILVIDSYGYDFHFGKLGCKLFWTIENANKIGTRPFLTVLSIERALILKRPNLLKIFTLRRSIILFSTLVLFIILCVSPIFYYSNIVSFDFLIEGVQYNKTTVDRCVIFLPAGNAYSFSLFLCCIGFIIPTVIIIFAYVFIAHSAITRCRNVLNVGNNERISSLLKLSYLNSLLIGLYLLCWPTFWITIFFSTSEEGSTVTPDATFFFTFLAYPLAIMNSALNWIAYVFMVRPIYERYCRITAGRLLQQRSDETPQQVEE